MTARGFYYQDQRECDQGEDGREGISHECRADAVITGEEEQHGDGHQAQTDDQALESPALSKEQERGNAPGQERVMQQADHLIARGEEVHLKPLEILRPEFVAEGERIAEHDAVPEQLRCEHADGGGSGSDQGADGNAM